MARPFIKYCKKPSCNDCDSMHYNSKAQRWCYDEKYGLSTDHGERYSMNGKVQRVLTGIIEHTSYSEDGNNSTCGWELNFTEIFKEAT